MYVGVYSSLEAKCLGISFMEDRRKSGRRFLDLCAVGCILLSVSMASLWIIKVQEQKRKTVLYSTDLAIDGDFDDYFDLVVMKSLAGIDLTIIVDGNDSGQKQSGVDAILNLDKIAGEEYRQSKIIIGRSLNLENMYDPHVSDDLVNILKNAKGKVDIVTVGSLRDIAALYNYSPSLFERKTDRIWIFAGDAEGTMTEWNVALDETAFLRIMNSGELNIYWIPCFQKGIWTAGSNASYFTARHEEVLSDADDSLQKWFYYRFEKSRLDFQNYMASPQIATEFMDGTRNLWCAPLFPLIDGSMEEYLEAYNQERNENIDLPCGFSEKRVMFSEGGRVEYGVGNRIQVFEIYDYDAYADLMKYILRRIYSNWNN